MGCGGGVTLPKDDRHAYCIVPTVESMRGDNLALADAWRKVVGVG
ncbi:MAG: hypothetical protein AAGJ38_00995 [Planctomycetota bacterium]